MCYNVTMRKINIKAYAKINLCFDIIGKDEEKNMHFVDTIMQTIDLYDVLTITKRRDKKCTVTVENDKVTDTNAIKAAEKFVEVFNTTGVDIHIIKNIPVGAGLGGSSADAAGVLRGMAILYEISFTELTDIAASIGADVPFLLHGGLARCTGFGEKVEILPQIPPLAVLVAYPNSGVSTEEAYARFDKQSKKTFNVRIDDILNNIRENKNNRILSTNILFNIVSVLNPDVANVAKYINSDKIPFHATMTGSGSAYYALYQDIEKAYAHKANAPSEINAQVYQFVSSY